MGGLHYLERELDHLFQKDGSLWRFVQDGSLSGVWFWDLEHPDNTWLSPEFWRLLGYDPEQQAHSTAAWHEQIQEEDRSVMLERLAVYHQQPDLPFDHIVRYRHSDGGIVWCRCRAMAIRDETGRAVRVFGVHADLTSVLTDHNRARARLKRKVLDTVVNAIVALDRDGRIRILNAAASQLFGIELTDEPTDLPSQMRIWTATGIPTDHHSNPFQRAIRGEHLDHELFRIASPTGPDNRYFRVSSSQAEDDEFTAVRTILVFDDVTREEQHRREAEKAARLSALGTFTGGLAHDFNNLLSTQLAAVQMARKKLDPEGKDPSLKIAEKTIRRAADLTNSLLEFARDAPSSQALVRIGDALREAIEMFETDETIGVEIVEDAELDRSRVMCDVGQLESALLNLAINARDAIRSSGCGNRIRLGVKRVAMDDKDKRRGLEKSVAIYVEDNGPGMSAAVRDQALDPFFSTKDRGSGTGLGLSLVFAFAKRHGGDLTLTSQLGKGTRVELLLPTIENQHLPSETKTSADAMSVDAGASLSVLVVDDEADLLALTTDGLRDEGHDAQGTLSPELALEILAEYPQIDILVTDVVMPGAKDGPMLAEQAVRLRPDLKVVYISGFAENLESIDGRPLLKKPFALQDLVEVLQQIAASKPGQP
ncbi:MAG: ATP-binding protein [Filomicrobium sp.]